jgi:hypothetical protein
VTRPQHALRRAPVRQAVDTGRLWAGGLAAAAVAALTAIVGFLITRGLFGIPVLAPKGDGVWGNASTPTYAACAALAALLATGVIHLLVLFRPAPFQFFGWLMILAVIAGVLAPFATGAALSAKMATAAINLAIGVAIWTLVASATRSAQRYAAAGTGLGGLDGLDGFDGLDRLGGPPPSSDFAD